MIDRVPVRQKERYEERGEGKGWFLWMIGKTVSCAYKTKQNPIQAVTTLKIVRLTPNKYTERPAKKRKREIWSSTGITSMVTGICHASTPSLKNARIRARLWGL